MRGLGVCPQMGMGSPQGGSASRVPNRVRAPLVARALEAKPGQMRAGAGRGSDTGRRAAPPRFIPRTHSVQRLGCPR